MLAAVAVLGRGFDNLNRNRKPSHENLFNSIVGGMFAEGIMPPGDILDAGANRGDSALFYATVAPSRTVRAIDPHLPNVHTIRKLAANANLSNVGRAVDEPLPAIEKLGYHVVTEE